LLARMETETAVEVKVDAEDVWYCATWIDLTAKGLITVKFDDDVWKARDLHPTAVRKQAPLNAAPLQPNDEVEVRIAAQGQPVAWAKGRVKTVKSGFYFVTLNSSGPGRQSEMIVEKADLRVVSQMPHLNPKEFEREIVRVDPELHKWVLSPDAVGCFEHVINKSGVTNVACDSSSKAPCVVLLGDARATHRAKLLMEVHFKHQKEIQRFHDRREDKLKVLEQRKQAFAQAFREEFTIDEDCVGLVIGKNGENLRRVQEDHEVEVNVIRDKPPKVSIVGQSKTAVECARKELEFDKECWVVEENMIGWVLGKNRKNLDEFKEKSGIVGLRWVAEKSHIELIGLKQQIEDTIMLLEGHSQYHSVYKEMDREQENLQSSFADLGRMGGKGGWKGGKKSEADDKGKGKGSVKGKGKSKDSREEPEPAKAQAAPDMGKADFPDLAKNGKPNGKSKSKKGK